LVVLPALGPVVVGFWFVFWVVVVLGGALWWWWWSGVVVSTGESAGWGLREEVYQRECGW
jgi:hypothetical protein